MSLQNTGIYVFSYYYKSVKTPSTLARVTLLAFSLAGCGLPQIHELDPDALDTSRGPVCSVDLIKSNLMTSVTECQLPLSLAPDKTPPKPLSKAQIARNRALAKQACREDRRFCFR